jgi:hypothetical protein
MSAATFIVRRLLAWGLLFIFILVLWSSFMGRAPGWPFGALVVFTLTYAAVRSFSHIGRVRLLVEHLDAASLANRHRRRIELPMPAGAGFDLVDAAIRELPYVENVESARDSLQVFARIRRVDAYIGGKKGRRDALGVSGARRNLVRASISPAGPTSSATIVCEPEGGAWLDWFYVDDGTNLENAEALTRAITRRVADTRKAEQASVRESATEKELAVAKLNLLHAQVEPHFLYNTLASAQLLTRTDPAKADGMIGNLIAYLRNSVPRADDAPSTLGEEVERARAYLEIMRLRMGERLSVQIEVPEALKPVPLPAMMLQTLAENAIKHGLETVSGGGNVWIFARENAGQMSVTVADDGRGLGGDTAGTGIGLRNLRERLKLAYGDEASFALVSNFPRGVAATISVPLAGPMAAPRG